MKITYNWLKEFIEGLESYSPMEIAHKLTMSGTEIKKIEYAGASYKNIIVARIESFIRHPNADKLSLCKVNSGTEILNIVCGAQNFKEKDTVVLALEGATLGDITIKKSKIRGEYSEGMMCSEKELGLSQESDGILILSDEFELGGDFAKQAGLDDWIFEIEVTPNRPDCLSVTGIAREICANTGLIFKNYDYNSEKEINNDKNFLIEIKDFNLCPRYSGKIFNDIPKKETPFWMKNRLALCDVRSVDLIVDLTNYVMIESGQPMHAFDADLLASRKIIIRPAVKNESIVAIDGSTKSLDEEAIVIADEKGPVAIAGIMGGKSTEINEETKNVFLESANFNGPSIMKTSKKIGLRSEASNRFEKKIDPLLTLTAIKRFEELLSNIAGIKSGTTIYDSSCTGVRERNIELRYKKIKQVLGLEIEEKKLSGILNGLGIKNAVGPEMIFATIPSFRFEDLEREVDLVEEIARIYGFENIPAEQLEFKSRNGKYSFSQKKMMEIRKALEDAGLNEAVNYSFIGLRDFKFFFLDEEGEYKDYVKILNPLNEDFNILRTSLIQSLVKNLKDNVSKKLQDLRIFEISKIFLKNILNENGLPLEKTRLAVLFSGRANLKSWNSMERFYDYYDIKGLLEYIFDKFKIKDSLKIISSEHRFFHPVISGDIYYENEKLGIIGKIHPKLVDALDIKQDAYYLELDLDSFIEKTDMEKKFRQIPQFPPICIDIAIVINEDVINSDIEEEIYKNSGNMLAGLRLFDSYKGKQIEEGKKSLAYSLEFQAEDRTLKDIEIDIITKRILGSLNKKYGASLRQ